MLLLSLIIEPLLYLSMAEYRLLSAALFGLYVAALVALARPSGVTRRVLVGLPSNWAALPLGISIPLLPVLGSHGVILAGVLLLVLCADIHATLRRLLWAAPAIAFLAGSVIIETLTALHLQDTSRGFFGGVTLDSLERILDIARSLFESEVTTWGLLTRVTLFALLLQALSDNRELRNSFAKGVLIGCTVAAGGALLNGVGLSPNQTEFWTKINRISSTLSDPNALGVVMALALWIDMLGCSLFAAQSKARKGWLLLITVAGLLSGSRTFILSLLLLVFFVVAKRERRVAVGLVALAVLGFIVLNLASLFFEGLSPSIALLPMPEGMRRVITTLTISEWNEAFFSRSIFTQLNMAFIKSAPFFGSGADRFRDYAPLISEQYNLGLGSWVDNANNLYLGIVSELGIFGVIAALLAAYGRRVLRAGPRLAAAALATLAIIFITGPHVEFPEVLVLVALVLALCTEATSLSRLSHVGVAALFVAGAFGAIVHESGVYGWRAREEQSERILVRWLTHNARINLPCKQIAGGSEAVITLRAKYIPSSAPIKVTLSTGIDAGKDEQTLELRSSQDYQVRVRCAELSKEVGVSVLTRPAWSPYRASPGRSNDRRILGVQQVLD